MDWPLVILILIGSGVIAAALWINGNADADRRERERRHDS